MEFGAGVLDVVCIEGMEQTCMRMLRDLLTLEFHVDFFFLWEILDFIQHLENQIHHVHTHVPLDWDIPPARQ